MLGRLSLSALMAVGALVSFLTPASAELPDAFPSKPVTLIVPFQAGVTADLLFRGIAESASKHLGQPVVIDNKPGGSATLGPGAHGQQRQARRLHDRRRSPSPCSASRYMQKATFDPVKDFTYIIHLGGYTFGAVVKADGPFKNWPDVIALAKANPGKFTYATPGAGHVHCHRHGADRAANPAVKLTHVPVQGRRRDQSPPCSAATSRCMVDSTGWAPLVDAGQLRLLMI